MYGTEIDIVDAPKESTDIIPDAMLEGNKSSQSFTQPAEVHWEEKSIFIYNIMLSYLNRYFLSFM